MKLKGFGRLLLRIFFGLFAILLAALSVMIAIDGVREYGNLSRLETEAKRVTGTIVRIDVERQSGSRDRRNPEYTRLATVRYEFADNFYEPRDRHTLTGASANLAVGSPMTLLVLPDQPGKPYAPDTIAGSWFVLFAAPLLLAALAALVGGLAWSRRIWR